MKKLVKILFVGIIVAVCLAMCFGCNDGNGGGGNDGSSVTPWDWNDGTPV